MNTRINKIDRPQDRQLPFKPHPSMPGYVIYDNGDIAKYVPGIGPVL